MPIEAKKVLFVCDRYPSLEMVMDRDTTTIIDGKIIKTASKYIRFVKTPYGGHFETSDKAQIAVIEASQYFRDGFIVRFAGDIEAARSGEKKHAAPVHQGMVGSGPRADDAKAKAPWAGEQREAGAAMVPEHA